MIIYMDLKSFAMIKASLLSLARHAWQNPETPDSSVIEIEIVCFVSGKKYAFPPFN